MITEQTAVVEIAILTVEDQFTDKLEFFREGLRVSLRDFPGLLEMMTMTPVPGSISYADIVTWDTINSAMAAVKAFEQRGERFAPYSDATGELQFIGHFRL